MVKLQLVIRGMFVEAELIKMPVGGTIWTGRAVCFKTQTVQEFSWTDEQLCAVLALGPFSMGVDPKEGYDIARLYDVADPLFADWPAGMKLIP